MPVTQTLRDSRRIVRKAASTAAPNAAPTLDPRIQAATTKPRDDFECRIEGRRYRVVSIARSHQINQEVGAPSAYSGDLLRLDGHSYVLTPLEPNAVAPAEDLQRLTGRELQIAHKIAAGKSDKAMNRAEFIGGWFI
jgi:hypothetical protein